MRGLDPIIRQSGHLGVPIVPSPGVRTGVGSRARKGETGTRTGKRETETRTRKRVGAGVKVGGVGERVW